MSHEQITEQYEAYLKEHAAFEEKGVNFNWVPNVGFDNRINFEILFEIDASIIFWVPIIFVLINSIGLYSAAGTCFKAAACIT